MLVSQEQRSATAPPPNALEARPLPCSSQAQERWTKSTQTPLAGKWGGLTPSLASTFSVTMGRSQLCGGRDISVRQV